MSNQTNFNEEEIKKLKTVFDLASLHTPSFVYDDRNLLPNVGITIAAYTVGLAPIIIFALATLPSVTIYGLAEIGNLRANKMRARVENKIEQEPERFTEPQLVEIAHTINVTYISPLWPIKALRLRKKIASLEETFDILLTAPINKIGSILEGFKPVTFPREVINNDFTLRTYFAHRGARIQAGRDLRRAARIERRAARITKSPAP